VNEPTNEPAQEKEGPPRGAAGEPRGVGVEPAAQETGWRVDQPPPRDWAENQSGWAKAIAGTVAALIVVPLLLSAGREFERSNAERAAAFAQSQGGSAGSAQRAVASSGFEAGDMADLARRDPLAAAARAGNAAAQYELGVQLAKGEGRPKNESAAHAWLLRSARAGYPKAQYAAAWCASVGFGTPKDEAEQRDWLIVAADNNELNAQYALGVILLDEGDRQKGSELIEKAARQGNADAIGWMNAASKVGAPSAPAWH
jgi:TPR repeat protein